MKKSIKTLSFSLFVCLLFAGVFAFTNVKADTNDYVQLKNGISKTSTVVSENDTTNIRSEYVGNNFVAVVTGTIISDIEEYQGSIETDKNIFSIAKSSQGFVVEGIDRKHHRPSVRLVGDENWTMDDLIIYISSLEI